MIIQLMLDIDLNRNFPTGFATNNADSTSDQFSGEKPIS